MDMSCFLIVLPCEVHPCKNGGICSNEKDGGFKCACRNGYGGLLCTQKGIRCIYHFDCLLPTNLNTLIYELFNANPN